MSILDELIGSVAKLEVDEQLRILCDQIFKEEVPEPTEYEGPEGANIFLSLPFEIKNDKTYENYICLEREAQGAYIISHWNCLLKNNSIPKRVKAWTVKNDITKKILKEFAERLEFLKGE